MPKKKHDLLFDFRVLIAVCAAVLFVLGLTLVAEGRVDTERFRAELQKAVKNQTGQNLIVKGKITVSLLPTPTLYLPGVELQSGDRDAPQPSATVAMVRLGVSFATILTDRPQITDIAFDQPSFALSRTDSGDIRWGWLTPQLLAGLGKGAGLNAVSISDGKLILSNPKSDRAVGIEHINAGGTLLGPVRISGAFTAYGHTLRLTLAEDPAASPAAPGALPVSLRLYADDKNHLEWKGGVSLPDSTIHTSGALTLELEDALPWLSAVKETPRDLLGQLTNRTSDIAPSGTALPVKLSAAWTGQGSSVSLSDLSFKGIDSEGTGTLSLDNGAIPLIKADLSFLTLDYNKWRQFTDKILPLLRPGAKPADKSNDAANPLPKDIAVQLKLATKGFIVGGQNWGSAEFSAKLEDQSITVDQLHIGLPGDASLFLAGVVVQGSSKAMRFEGNMETKGKSLRQMLTVFDDSAAQLPEAGFGDFYVRSNIFVSPDQVRLSEADVKINDLRLSGGLVAYFDANPRLEAEMKLQDIDFDYFRDVWRNRDRAQPQDFILTLDKSQSYAWLKKLQTTIDFKINVDRFTFLERKGSNASLRIYARQGELGLYNMKFTYPEETLEGSLALNVKGEQPVFNVALTAAQFDTGYFSHTVPKADPKTPPAAKRWPEELIDMSWMNGINAAFDLNIRKLSLRDRELGNVKFKAKLENNLLSLESFSFGYWGGTCNVTGSLYGGTVPGVSIGFTLYDADIQSILSSVAGRENVTGKMSISGTLATSGVNPLSWVSQSDATLVLAGRGVSVQGLSLQGVIDAVQKSRTAADVVNNVNLALVHGSSQLSVDGNVNVKNGVMRTPGITLKTGTITGNLTGEVKLVPWTMELSTLFQFPTMTSETTPTMTVQLAGPIDKPQLQTDTASLEAYVAKRIVGTGK